MCTAKDNSVHHWFSGRAYSAAVGGIGFGALCIGPKTKRKFRNLNSVALPSD